MRLIYWNTQKSSDIDRIKDIISSKQPDLLFLSEIDPNVLLENIVPLNFMGYDLFQNPGCERVIIIKKIDLELNLSLQDSHYTTVKINSIDIYIIAVHLPSQFHRNISSTKKILRDFRSNIDSEIGSSIDEKILIIGDFNASPHDKSMIDFDGFKANNSVKSRKKITRDGDLQYTYYNPTWKLYNRSHFPGTIRYNRPSAYSYDILEFHILDQVVVSQLLLKNIKEEIIEVIESTDNYTFLCTQSGQIESSDHLPISYQFTI